MPPIRRVNKGGSLRKRETRRYWDSRPIWHHVAAGEGKVQFWEECCGCVPCGKATTIELTYPTIRIACRPRYKNLTNALVIWHDNTGLGHTATTIQLEYPTTRFKNLTNALVIWHDNTGLGHTVDFNKCTHETIIDGFDAATGPKAAFECKNMAELGEWYDAVMNEVADAISNGGCPGEGEAAVLGAVLWVHRVRQGDHHRAQHPTICIAIRPRFKNVVNALVVWHDNTGLGHTVDFNKCTHEE
ncbi:unnamed protein product [Vitrella brassicaformis CCMP3155]|uniref:Uncharacterized protein n=1 Tax=Vitrella brassicaformis (strain CCMP3155) TaxID=1169540 RepID=A0A0G4GV81_VITBC|nr:unnamed protein product [Vitrella brassicaformis CCMP3155]|eukprot:CEM34786.1 unnamed protein product [Vitrella brassicaformis CCMP3155]